MVEQSLGLGADLQAGAVSSPAKRLRTLRRMLAWRTQQTDSPPHGASAPAVNGWWRERKALEWALEQLDPGAQTSPSAAAQADSPADR